MRELACVAHVHSTLSDGTATVPEIAAAASEAGADAVLLTDHDTLAARRLGLAGSYGRVQLVVGVEVSAASGHLLAFGLPEEVDHAGRSAAEIWGEVRDAGGIGFAAHPTSGGSVISRHIGRPHPWTDIAGCEGMGLELWSLVTDAAEAWRGARDAGRFLRSPALATDGPPARAIAVWDRLCASRRVPIIGGLDAHQTGIRVGARVLSPMPHARYFRLLQTHLLCHGDGDERGMLDAMAEGRAFLARPCFAEARGFRYRAEDAERRLEMGAEAAIGAGWTLRVTSPRDAHIRLLSDGRVVCEATGSALEHRVTAPGAYRVEARLPVAGASRLWIISNPIYLR